MWCLKNLLDGFTHHGKNWYPGLNGTITNASILMFTKKQLNIWSGDV